MSYQYGKDWRIKVKTGASTYATLGGEGQWDYKVSSDKIDFSSKDDVGVKAQGFGLRAIDFSVQGKVKIPDAGLKAVSDASKAVPPEIEMQLVDAAGIVKYDGMMGVGNFSASGPDNAPVTYSFDLAAIQTPTVEDLMAVV